ncbi:MAG TPA: methyl-accepting chemotaxis protein [Noviherbaspirillum sp.]|jgi:aerotaxis receptor|uniref:methyl-accepting chemotaxis protein n=1 Tax=Noviherbaspirillum sp. TaxID=1926288 RepID=UPI002F925774
MRTNLPVTAREYQLRDGVSIVSKTDLKGRITYVNPYFIEVSGFCEDELLGAPHNLVRHPDMPPAAFADLWRCLKAEIPWTGMVKNRRKDGDFYWVQANVTPVREAGRVVGYLSVRTRPSNDQVAAADALYRRMGDGDTGVALRHGAVVRTGWRGTFAELLQLSTGMRLGLGLGLPAVLTAVLAAVAVAEGAPAVQAGGLGGAGVLACILAWRSLHAGLVRPIDAATDAARHIASGDMTARFGSGGRDQLGQMLNALQQMNVNLQAVIGDVRDNVGGIHTGSREIALGNHGLSSRTEAQAASLEETASSMEELASAVKQTASHAAGAHRLGVEASAIAGRGGDTMREVVRTMEDISAASKKVMDIVGIIDGIAFQTNLLALNAAVEAARAGEQGRGFAVVAAEVRGLAQRSAGAAKEIKQLIDSAVHKVDDGMALVGQAGETMSGIVQAVQGVTTLMADISTASAEQDAGIEQVNRAIAQMDEGTQQNAALVEQAAAAAESLAEQASRLTQAVAMFRFGDSPAQ